MPVQAWRGLEYVFGRRGTACRHKPLGTCRDGTCHCAMKALALMPILTRWALHAVLLEHSKHVSGTAGWRTKHASRARYHSDEAQQRHPRKCRHVPAPRTHVISKLYQVKRETTLYVHASLPVCVSSREPGEFSAHLVSLSRCQTKGARAAINARSRKNKVKLSYMATVDIKTTIRSKMFHASCKFGFRSLDLDLVPSFALG